MLHFCTLFDSFYLSRGIAMYESLRAHLKNFKLYIFTFDDLAHAVLIEMKLKNLSIISLQEFESKELIDVKPFRSKAEYCWTCTPAIIEYSIRRFDLPSCTYLDADLYFYHSPEILLEELKPSSQVLITEHRYSWLHKIYEENRAGRFCVQFITFKNQEASLQILHKWQQQCLDWCYDRYEDGKFGDQKYLDEWPDDYPEVHILEHHGGGLAPWNVQQYQIRNEGDQILIRKRRIHRDYKLVFYHFQNVRFLKTGLVDIGWHRIPRKIIRQIYQPYIRHLNEIEERISNMNPQYEPSYSNYTFQFFKEPHKWLLKHVFAYNQINTNFF